MIDNGETEYFIDTWYSWYLKDGKLVYQWKSYDFFEGEQELVLEHNYKFSNDGKTLTLTVYNEKIYGGSMTDIYYKT